MIQKITIVRAERKKQGDEYPIMFSIRLTLLEIDDENDCIQDEPRNSSSLTQFRR